MALTCAAFVSLKFPTPATLPLLFRERRYRRLRSGPLLLSYLVLLRVGFTLPRASLPERCALALSPVERAAPFHPYPSPIPVARART